RAARRASGAQALRPGRQRAARPRRVRGGVRPRRDLELPGPGLSFGGLRLLLFLLGLLLGGLFRLRAGVAVGTGLLAPAAAAVVGRVEAGAPEEDRHRMQHLLDRPLAADLTDRRRRIVHSLEDLEQVSVRATVFVDRHGPWQG